MTLPSVTASSAVDMGAGGNGTTFVLTRPGAWISGKTAEVGIYKENNAAITPPSGWVLVDSFNSGSNFWCYTYRKVLGGSEPSTYTWSWTGSVWREGGGFCLDNTDQTTPEDAATPVHQANAASTTTTVPAITPVTSNTLLVAWGFIFNDETWTPASGLSRATSNVIRAYCGAVETGPAAGVSSGTNTFTTIGSFANVGMQHAVQEVQGGGGASTGAPARRRPYRFFRRAA